MKKLFLTLIFFLTCSTQAHAVITYYLCGNSAGGNWNNTGIWTTIAADQTACIGGTGNYPGSLSTDIAVLGTTGGGSGGGNVLMNGNYTIATLDMTGYAGTFAFGSSHTLTVSGLATLQGNFSSTSGIIIANGGVTLASTPTGLTFPKIIIENTGTLTWNGYTWPGILAIYTSSTITLSGNLIVNTITNMGIGSNGYAPSFSGNYNVQCNTLSIMPFNNNNTSFIFSIVAGTTWTITNSLNLFGNSTAGGAGQFVFESGTPSSPAYLNYTGSLSNESIFGIQFTDIQAQGTCSQFYGCVLKNMNGGTLTRTQGIVNVTAANIQHRQPNYSNGV